MSVSARRRKRWETDDDLRSEAEAQAIIEQAWACRLHKLAGSNERKYRFDFAVTRSMPAHGDTIIAYLEYKRRSGRLKGRPHVSISADKWRSGIALTLVPPFVPVIFAFGFDDGLFYVEYDPHLPDQLVGLFQAMDGRWPPRDEGDIEPMVHIPTVNFKRVIGGTKV